MEHSLNTGVSVIICTYNGKERLSQTLNHLASQKTSIPCEIIFVDNASTDGSKEFADAWWKNNGTSKIAFHSFIQPILGKSNAQELGYEKAQYKYMLVCDDDNWLSDVYVETAFNIMEQNPNIGALGGWCEAVFENEKPEWFDVYAKYFAVSKQGNKTGDITQNKGCLYGAGMVLCKSHWLQLKSLEFEHLLSCRKGNNLSSGGDTEYSFALRLLGYSIWYDDRLYFKHFMSGNRLNLKYVSRLRKAMSYSNFVLWPYRDLLNGKTRKKSHFYKQAFKDLKTFGINRFWLLFTGDYEEKEMAKLYFRNLYFLFFSYSEYKKNLIFISNWYSISKS